MAFRAVASLLAIAGPVRPGRRVAKLAAKASVAYVNGLCWLAQVIVFDKLEYCGTLKNLDSVINKPNFKVCIGHGGLSHTCTTTQPPFVLASAYDSFSSLVVLSSDAGSRCTPQFIKGDLQSGDLLNYILRRENVDTVLHFAAQVREAALIVHEKMRDF